MFTSKLISKLIVLVAIAALVLLLNKCDSYTLTNMSKWESAKHEEFKKLDKELDAIEDINISTGVTHTIKF